MHGALPMIGMELLVWAAAAGITLMAYLAVSLADFRELAGAAVRASSPVLWLPPAMMLISADSAVQPIAGVLLIANMVRLLLWQHPPDRPFHPREPGMLGPVIGACVFELGVCAVFSDRPFTGAALFAAGSAAWTRSAIARGVAKRPLNRPHPALAFLMIIALPAGAPGISEIAHRMFASRKPTTSNQPAATRVFIADDETGNAGGRGIPGVVLRTAAPAKLRAPILKPGTRSAITIKEPLEVPFTGEYHLYRASMRNLPPDAVIHPGTPLDAVYGTTNNSAMQTEAYQALDPPLDLTHCGRIRVVLTSAEITPAAASMEAVAGAKAIPMGTQIFGLFGPREEVVEFEAPPRQLLVRAIRIFFRHNPAFSFQNTKVAIRSFTFLPR